MQTFLPYPDFAATAAVLDHRRLGKQRVEALQVARGLTVPGYGWRHHPVVRMWKGHDEALAAYGVAICSEWCGRGFADTCRSKILLALGVDGPLGQEELAASGRLPPWLGDEELHRSHRSSLLRKDPGWYGARFPGERDDLPYVWPVDPFLRPEN